MGLELKDLRLHQKDLIRLVDVKDMIIDLKDLALDLKDLMLERLGTGPERYF